MDDFIQDIVGIVVISAIETAILWRAWVFLAMREPESTPPVDTQEIHPCPTRETDKKPLNSQG